MRVSIILTVNNRSPEVSHKVAESLGLPGNEVDEVIIVLDRPTPEAKRGAETAYMALADEPNPTFLAHKIHFIEVGGKPGWKGPARAWNAGIKAATGDLLYCISSETIQDAGNVEKAKAHFWDGSPPWSAPVSMNKVVFGACHNSEPVNLVVGAEPGLLVSSKMPRPLGFIACMPAWAVRKIGGFDEGFMDGFWYDDDDFFLRLWYIGVNFVFDDSIHGIHLHHERPDLKQAGIQRNAALMMQKHGTLHPWGNLLRVEEWQEGRLIWRHP